MGHPGILGADRPGDPNVGYEKETYERDSDGIDSPMHSGPSPIYSLQDIVHEAEGKAITRPQPSTTSTTPSQSISVSKAELLAAARLVLDSHDSSLEYDLDQDSGTVCDLACLLLFRRFLSFSLQLVVAICRVVLTFPPSTSY